MCLLFFPMNINLLSSSIEDLDDKISKTVQIGDFCKKMLYLDISGFKDLESMFEEVG